jgi:Transglutaminase-like superfamily
MPQSRNLPFTQRWSFASIVEALPRSAPPGISAEMLRLAFAGQHGVTEAAGLGPIDRLRCFWAGIRAATDYYRGGFDQVANSWRRAGGIVGARPVGVGELRVLAYRVDRIIRLMFGRQRCLFHATAICAALRVCVDDAQVVFGHESAQLRGSPSPVHAWVAVGDQPINVLPGIENAYFEIARLPALSSGAA